MVFHSTGAFIQNIVIRVQESTYKNIVTILCYITRECSRWNKTLRLCSVVLIRFSSFSRESKQKYDAMRSASCALFKGSCETSILAVSCPTSPRCLFKQSIERKTELQHSICLTLSINNILYFLFTLKYYNCSTNCELGFIRVNFLRYQGEYIIWLIWLKQNVFTTFIWCKTISLVMLGLK